MSLFIGSKKISWKQLRRTCRKTYLETDIQKDIVVYNFFAEIALAMMHHHGVTLHAVLKVGLRVTVGAFHGLGRVGCLQEVRGKMDAK